MSNSIRTYIRVSATTVAVLILYLAVSSREVQAQPKCTFTSYSVDDGLSEGVVLAMHQDRQGFMWFGTFDGLNRFDGYSFKVYKSGFRSNTSLRNNRVDRIIEDDLGYLWIMTNDGEVYRMNTRTEEFIYFNEIDLSTNENYSPVKQVWCFPGGETWMTSESGKCIRVVSKENSSDYISDSFFSNEKGVTALTTNLIYSDSHDNVWFLRNDGLSRLEEKSLAPEKVRFHGSLQSISDLPFFSACELSGTIWFGASEGMIVGYSHETGRYDEVSLDIRSGIIAVKQLNQKEIIALTSSDGFFIYNPVTGDKKHFSEKQYPALPSDEMVSVYIDKYGEAWIETTAPGVVNYDPFSGSLKHFRMKVDKTDPNVLLPSFVIFEDKNDVLWLYPRGGGFSFFNRAERKLEYFFNEPGSPDRRFPNLIHSALSDSQGNMWICTVSRGIEKITFYPNQFRVLKPKTVTTTHSENEVRAIYEDRYKNLWVATRDGYVYQYDSTGTGKGTLRNDGTFGNGYEFNALVYSITQDRAGRIWLGSKGRGVFCLDSRNGSNNAGYRIRNYRHDPQDVYSLSHDNVYTVFEDCYGRIWVGTFNGGLNYLVEDNSGARFINSNNELKGYPLANHKRIRHISADSHNNIWVGTTNGLLVFDQRFKSPSEIRFRAFSYDPGDEGSLANNDVHFIYSSPEKEIYVATFGGGLNKVINPDFGEGKPVFRSFTVSNGAPDDIILSIVDDMSGNLWLSSERGILKFDKKNESFEIFSDQSGVERRYFSEAACCRKSDNEIMFGFDDGVYRFDPSTVRKTNFIPPIVVSRVTISGTEINGAGMFSSSPVTGAGNYKLELRPRQKTLTIEYAALDYRNPGNIQYAHMLEGFDKDWLIERGRRTATYNNLEPGRYVFRVKSTNSDGIWTDNERSIDVVVIPSFWQTFLAKVLIVLLVLTVIIITIYVILTFYKLRHKVEVEQLITNLKLKFFTDISHELRTPLTLISSPVDNILKDNSLTPDIKEQLTLVQNNTQRMLRLVNQILDFRKVQSNKMKLKIEEFILVDYIREICSNFTKIAEDKGIVLNINDLSERERIWADKDKVEKIMYNLLSNALKFTPRGKNVSVTVTRHTDTVELAVSDQGTGLTKEKMKKLFTRFDSEGGENITMQPGTGIGLSLSRELAELQKAELFAESEEGKGATFRVIFKSGFTHFENDTEFLLSDNLRSTRHGIATDEIVELEEEDKGDDEPVLLFVEDNEELRSFIKIVLSDGFHVIEAGNGREGLEIARSQLPDIIITDLMMPEKDGLEMARELRNDHTTSHIPVVVLTAKTDLDTQLEALQTGADDYITKPFSSTYLRAKIESIIQQRKKLQELFLANLTNYKTDTAKKIIEINPSHPEVESYDDKLLKRLMEIMEENLDNSSLTVDELVSKVGIGRSVFFKKLKSLTGLAPVEFVREVRVKRAAQLIETGQFTIAQITYMVGCNDPRYFSRIFKNRFGLTPSEYKDKKIKSKQNLL